MITRLTIKNFKSHRHTDLSLGALNLFAGRNGVGKSSAIQALLLLKQTADRKRLDKGLELNGDLCKIGLGKDALHSSADTDTIGISLDLDRRIGIELEFDVEKSLKSTFIPRKYNPSYESTDDSPLELWSDSGANFQYLSA
jgi:AAA15 family ATPase/GTPase